ncbi:hypothetical protein DPX16_17373 [Anabarilius grahami]|uniref:Uncharacterized protein n=1 Tax=Anabarilius grahami TaxID=495550 RepID=A0A3N0Y0H9_ANAGA|nr:hypothetical protein DPX16_17373 [Anabarilius grahami]
MEVYQLYSSGLFLMTRVDDYACPGHREGQARVESSTVSRALEIRAFIAAASSPSWRTLSSSSASPCSSDIAECLMLGQVSAIDVNAWLGAICRDPFTVSSAVTCQMSLPLTLGWSHPRDSIYDVDSSSLQ